MPWTKEDKRAASQRWRENNPEKSKEVQRKWRLGNPGKAKAAKDKWKLNNPDAEKIHKAKTKKFLDDYKELRGCRRCNFKDPRALQFHHRDPSTKLFNIANKKRANMDRLMAEIAKCDVICANCHFIEHAEEREGKLP